MVHVCEWVCGCVQACCVYYVVSVCLSGLLGTADNSALQVPVHSALGLERPSRQIIKKRFKSSLSNDIHCERSDATPADAEAGLASNPIQS